MQPCFTDLYDFSPFDNVRRWLDDMRQFPSHDDAHVVLAELGDISGQAPDIERIVNSNKRAVSALQARVAEFR